MTESDIERTYAEAKSLLARTRIILRQLSDTPDPLEADRLISDIALFQARFYVSQLPSNTIEILQNLFDLLRT